MVKIYTTKTPSDDFKVTILEIDFEVTIIKTSGYKLRNLSILYQPTIEPLSQYPIGLILK